MKLSEITLEYVKDYMGVSDTDSDGLIGLIMRASKAHILSYTGLELDMADLIEELNIAFLILCNEAFSTRTVTVANGSTNKAVECILNMHSINLL